jgi:hypothetical protein
MPVRGSPTVRRRDRQHEARRAGKAELRCQLARRLDGGRREVEADDGGAALRELQRVDAEMALQVQHAQATHVTELGVLDWVELGAAGPQRDEVVVAARAEMDFGPLVPVGAVELAPALDLVAHTESSAPVRRR